MSLEERKLRSNWRPRGKATPGTTPGAPASGPARSEPKATSHHMTRLLRTYLAPYRWPLSAVIVLLLVQAIANLYLPDLNADIINNGVAKGDINHIMVVGAIMLAMGVVPFALLWRSGLKMGETPKASAGRRGRNALSALVVGQVAIALVLLIGAGLLMHSFARVMAVNPGFDATRIVQGRVSLPFTRYKDPKDNVAIRQRILAAMKEIPGVETASMTTGAGVAESFQAGPFLLRGSNAAVGNAQALVYLNIVSPE